MRHKALLVIIASILATPSMADPITLLPTVVSDSSSSPYKMRFPFANNNPQNESETEPEEDEDTNTWLSLYQNNGRKQSVSEESQLEGVAIELGSLSLTSTDLPNYRYPANVVTSVNLSNNQLESLDFLRPSLTVSGDVDVSNAGVDDLSPIFRSAIGGDLDISNNPLVNDIALLGFASIPSGSHIQADPALQYQRLMDESSPLCQSILSGTVTISSSNGDTGAVYCEVQNEWVTWFQSRGFHSDLTHDSQLYGKNVYFGGNIDESGMPTSQYPVSVSGDFVFGSNAVISDTSQFSSLHKVGTLTISGGSVIGNTNGFRNIEETGALNINKGVISDLNDFNNLRIINGYVRIQDPLNPSSPDDFKLKDLRGIENAEVLGTSINFYNANYITNLPSGDATFCLKAQENGTTIYVARTNRIATICESGSEWQEFLEDVGSLFAINVKEGLQTKGFDMSYRNIIRPDDNNIPKTNVKVKELSSITLTSTAVSHIDFLADVERAGRVSFTHNSALSSFEGLRGMTVESLTIRENGDLTDLNALEELTVTDFIEISANDDYVRDLTFLDRMPLTYNKINPPSIGPETILPKGDNPFCKAISDRKIEIVSSNPQDLCDSHSFVEAAYDGAISPRANAYDLTSEMFRNKDVRLTARYIRDSDLESDTPLGVPIASFTAIDNRAISNLDFLRGITINQTYVHIGYNTSNLSDISGLEDVTFTENSEGKIILGGNGSRIPISGISNLDNSVKVLVINTLYNFPDRMTAEGNTCSRIRAGELLLEDTNGNPHEINDYCEEPVS